MLLFVNIFDRNGKRVSREITEERNVAIWRYKLFQSWFSRHYILQVGEYGLNPCYLFHKSLIQFGASICSYAKRWQSVRHVKIGISASEVVALVLAHIRLEWQDLLGAFEHLLKEDESKCQWFSWTGPSFKILQRDELQAWTELVDIAEDPVYRTRVDDGDEIDDLEDEEDESIKGIALKRPLTPTEGMWFSKRETV
jgi:hypothetical protein